MNVCKLCGQRCADVPLLHRYRRLRPGERRCVNPACGWPGPRGAFDRAGRCGVCRQLYLDNLKAAQQQRYRARRRGKAEAEWKRKTRGA